MAGAKIIGALVKGGAKTLKKFRKQRRERVKEAVAVDKPLERERKLTAREISLADVPLASGEFPRGKRPPPSRGGRRGMGKPTTGKGPLFREEGTSVRGKSRRGENPNLLAGGDSKQRRIADRELKEIDLEEGQYPGRRQAERDIERGTLKESPRRDLTISAAVRKTKESHARAITERKELLKERDKHSPGSKRFVAITELLQFNRNKMREIEEKGGTVVKKYKGRKGGGQVIPKKNRMSRVGLSPAEEARAGTEPEAKRRRYKKGGDVKTAQHGGIVQGYDARKDEQLGMTRGPERDKKMSMAGRRNVARATRKPKGTYGLVRRARGGLIGVGAALRGYGAVRKT